MPSSPRPHRLRGVLLLLAGVVLGVALAWLGLAHRAPATHTATTAVSSRSATPVTVPAPPTTAGKETAENDTDATDWPDDAPTPEQVIYAQPQRVREALQHLTPRVAGRTNLYVIAFAGDGSEDVFRNEAEYAAELFTRRFGATTHALVLENNPATLERAPLASWSNLEQALDGVYARMKPDQDILLLYLTTHGSEDHTLLVDMDPLPLDAIGAQDLPDILAEKPFRWKVVVVNACYSGGFVPPLAGAGTLVLTAARADRSSFGCGNDSAATYFGRAWLIDALNRTADPIAAFALAQQEVRAWEQRDHLPASGPQIAIGSGIAARLKSWWSPIVPGPKVPFQK